ncbi:hypothetical protein RRG08_054931 [Elysia crispata]|nr:hypothetical protein RRG08_054931 [Elysia crispata]
MPLLAKSSSDKPMTDGPQSTQPPHMVGKLAQQRRLTRDSIESPLRKSCALDVRGYSKNKISRRDSNDSHLQRTINAMQSFNDPLLFSPKQCFKGKNLTSGSTESSFSNNGNCLPDLFDASGSSSQVACFASSSTVSKIGRKCGSGDNILQSQLSEENDKELIKEIRQMLLQSMTRVKNANEAYGCSNHKLQMSLSCTPRAESPVLKAEPRLPQNSVQGFMHDITAGNSEADMEGLKGKPLNDGFTEKNSFSYQWTASDHEKTKQNMSYEKEYITMSRRKSTDNRIAQTILDNSGHQGKQVSFVVRDLVPTSSNDFGFSPASQSSQTGLKSTDVQRYKDQGLKLINKIKTSQQRLARVRVKSPLPSSSKDPVTEERDAWPTLRHQAARDKRDARRRKWTACKPPGKMTLGDSMTKSPSKALDRLAGGDFPVRSFQKMTAPNLQTRHTEESSASIMKSYREKRILCWLKGVEPLVEKTYP